MNQSLPIGSVGLVGLTPLFNGRVNICSHRRSHFNTKCLEKVLSF